MSVQSLSRVQLFATPWTTACHASLSITNSRSLPKLMSIESVMPSNHLILFHPLLLPPSIFPNIRVFSNESALCIRWPKYWSFSFNITPGTAACQASLSITNFLELTQTHVHQVGDAIQPSHPLLSPSPPALSLSQHQALFKRVSSLHQVAKVLEFQLPTPQ